MVLAVGSAMGICGNGFRSHLEATEGAMGVLGLFSAIFYDSVPNFPWVRFFFSLLLLLVILLFTLDKA